jgi:hypothetical protein
MTNHSEWTVYDPHFWWENQFAQAHNINFFPAIEILRDFTKIPENTKKAVILRFDLLENSLLDGDKEDFSWADLLLIFYPDLLETRLINNNSKKRGFVSKECASTDLEFVEVKFHLLDELIRTYIKPKKIIYIVGAICTGSNIDVRLLPDLRTFFSLVVIANQYQEINTETNLEHRDFMFDALLGHATKTSRLFLIYKILKHNLQNDCLINLYSDKFSCAWSEIEEIDPIGVKKFGRIENYTSDEIYSLEEPLLKKFKDNTKGKSPEERFSAKILTDAASANLLDANYSRWHESIYVSYHSVVIRVPWEIYKNSWYSLVCESRDRGVGINFVTEKTAKCLYAKRIFILFGAGQTLKYLKSIGFRTFHGEFIDESYDDEPNDVVRYKMAWKQVLNLYKHDPAHVYRSMKETLEHNHRLLKEWPMKDTKKIKNFISRHLDLDNDQKSS